jgi:hypothetical protein
MPVDSRPVRQLRRLKRERRLALSMLEAALQERDMLREVLKGLIAQQQAKPTPAVNDVQITRLEDPDLPPPSEPPTPSSENSGC